MSTEKAATATEAPSSNSESKNKTSPGKQITHFLISMKLALTLLFVIAILSIIGTILPQGDVVYQTDWVDNPLFDFYKTLGLFSMYSSWWFLSILTLLVLNLSVCITNRISSTIKHTFRPKIDVKDAFVANQPSAITLGGGEQAFPVAKELLKRSRFRIRTSQAGAVLAEKGRFSALASLAFHLSFVLIFVGGILGHELGYDYTLDVPDGRTAAVKNTNYTVKNHTFQIKYADIKNEAGEVVNYMPREYSSDIEIFKDGASIERKTITVNDPLRLDGVNFHQASYYWSGKGYVTVLEINHYPFKWLIYTGFVLMMAGICFTLYLPHRRIWLKVGKSGELLMGGRASRSKLNFQRDFDRMAKELRLKLGQEERADG